MRGKRMRLGRTVGLSLAALAAVAVAAAGVSLWRRAAAPPDARLIVWAESPQRWVLFIDDGKTGRAAECLECRLPPGEYTVALAPRLPDGGRGPPVESCKLRLEAGRVHVYSARGAPLSMTLRDGGRAAGFAGGVPTADPLWADFAQGVLGQGAVLPAGAAWVAADAPVAVYETGRRIEPSRAAGRLFLANPYDEALNLSVRSGAAAWDFELPPGGVRCVAVPPDATVAVKVGAAGVDGPFEEWEDAIPAGAMLYTVGGATCYAWRAAGAAADAPDAAIVAPDYLLPLEDEPCRLVLPSEEEPRGPGRPLLFRARGGGEELGLYALASAPLAPPEAGPPASLTTHPEVRVSRLPLPDALAHKPVECAAVWGDRIAVVVGGVLYDAATGRALTPPDGRLAAAAASPAGLTLLNRQARLAAVVGDRLLCGATVLDPTVVCWGGPRCDAAYFFGGQASGGVFATSPGGLRRILGPEHHVTAVGDSPDGLLVAEGRRILRAREQDGRWSLEPLLALPPGPPVLGLHDADGLLVFATEEACCMRQGDVVVPLVVGAGGPLYPYRGGLLIHDQRSLRLFVAQSSLFGGKHVSQEGGAP